MDDAGRVRVLERSGEVRERVRDALVVGAACPAARKRRRRVPLRGRVPPDQSREVGDDVVERAPFDALHRVEPRPGLLAHPVHRDDVRVVEPSGRVRLAPEALDRLRVERHRRVEDLQRDAAPHRRLLGLVDDAHAAAADFASEHEVAEATPVRGTRARSRCVALPVARRCRCTLRRGPGGRRRPCVRRNAVEERQHGEEVAQRRRDLGMLRDHGLGINRLTRGLALAPPSEDLLRARTLAGRHGTASGVARSNSARRSRRRVRRSSTPPPPSIQGSPPPGRMRGAARGRGGARRADARAARRSLAPRSRSLRVARPSTPVSAPRPPRVAREPRRPAWLRRARLALTIPRAAVPRRASACAREFARPSARTSRDRGPRSRRADGTPRGTPPGSRPTHRPAFAGFPSAAAPRAREGAGDGGRAARGRRPRPRPSTARQGPRRWVRPRDGWYPTLAGARRRRAPAGMSVRTDRKPQSEGLGRAPVVSVSNFWISLKRTRQEVSRASLIPGGTAAILVVLRAIGGYRMQLLLYAKGSGTAAFSTLDCWYGMDTLAATWARQGGAQVPSSKMAAPAPRSLGREGNRLPPPPEGCPPAPRPATRYELRLCSPLRSRGALWRRSVNVNRVHFALAFALGLVACGKSDAVLEKPAAPAALAVPAGNKLAFELRASGVQIYTCQPKKDEPTQFEWALTAPDAQLTDADGYPAGHHFAGPTWESTDGSKVVGKKEQQVEGPQSEARWCGCGQGASG